MSSGRGRGSGRGLRPATTMSEAEKYGFPPGFNMSNMEASRHMLHNPVSLTGGRGIVVDVQPEPVTEMERGTDYAKRVRQEEEEKAVKRIKELELNPEPVAEATVEDPNITDFEDTSTILGPGTDTASTIYLPPRVSEAVMASADSLPIDNHRSEIMCSIKLNQVTVIEGNTGCGKTTRVPVFVMEEILREDPRRKFNIIVTQPRRIAAISVAKRVASRWPCKLGTLIGYQIGMDKNFVSDKTRLLYCTTGILLQRLISTKSLAGITHIIVDEVHERGVETDLLLMIIRKLIWGAGIQDVKIILMSATFESQKFIEYFKMESIQLRPGLVKIEQRPQKLSAFYLDSRTISDILGPRAVPNSKFQINEPAFFTELVEACVTIIKVLPTLEQNTSGNPGSVLIFVPGLNEIREMVNRLKVISNAWILPLHSTIDDNQQRQVFEHPKRGHRKIIVATNIAESSITVSDIEYVIDFCLTKNLVVDAKTNFPLLQLEWASKANCQQRAGRAGRTREGRFIRLIPTQFFNLLKEYPDPEIVRTPLELCVLRVKKLNMGPPKDLLALCLDPPKLEDIRTAILRLKRVGGLTITMDAGDELVNDEIYDVEDGELTTIGEVMANLPIDVNLSKLILIGYAFGIGIECCIVSACLTIKTMFSQPHERELDSYKSKLAWADNSFSDLTAFLNAFEMYHEFKNSLGAKDHDVRRWCEMNFIQEKRIKEVEALSLELQKRLSEAGVSLETPPNSKLTSNDKELYLKIAICGAFYPNYFTSTVMDEVTISKMIPSSDPLSSVQISGLPQNQGVLYADQIRDIFKPCSEDIELDFEDTKAVVTFCDEKDLLQDARKMHYYFKDGQVLQKTREYVKTGVYVAVKMRLIRYELPIHVLKIEDAEKEIKKVAEDRESRNSKQSVLRSNRFVVKSMPNYIPRLRLPVATMSRVPVIVTHVDECPKFWCQYMNESILTEVEDALDHAVISDRPIQRGHLVRYFDATSYRRGRIQQVYKMHAEVFFIDYGYTEKLQLDQLDVIDFSKIPSNSKIHAPPQAFRCEMELIKPSSYRKVSSEWDPKAHELFKNFLENKEYTIVIEVYSVVKEVVLVEDVFYLERRSLKPLAYQLIEAGYAEDCDPSVQSRHNHEARKQAAAAGVGEEVVNDDSSYTVEPPVPSTSCGKTIRLKGPYSPLEMEFQGMTKQNFGLKSKIGADSVNSVALEPEPYSNKSRLMVAATITMSSESQKIVPRDTTIMPPIPGLSSLICLLFSPHVELRDDDKHKVYLGLLAGLGYDKKGSRNVARDPQNDIETKFDILITPQTIGAANIARYVMNSIFEALAPDENGVIRKLPQSSLYEKQNVIRTEVMNVIYPEEKRLKLVVSESRGSEKKIFLWGLQDPDLMAQCGVKTTSRTFLPIIKTIKELTDKSYIENLLNENYLNDDVLKTGLMVTARECLICGVHLLTVAELTKHMTTDESHKKRVLLLESRYEKESHTT